MESINLIKDSIKGITSSSFAKTVAHQRESFLENIKEALEKEFKSIYLLEKDFATELSNINTSVTKKTPTQESLSTALPAQKKEDIKINHKTEVSIFNKYDDIIREMSDKYQVSFDLIKKVIHTESTFNPDAISRSGAMGLMQLMPKTAAWLGVKNPMEPRDNIEGGVKYLHMMLNKYNGNTKLALAAYNAGPGNVDKYGTVPPFKETQNYIKKILG